MPRRQRCGLLTGRATDRLQSSLRADRRRQRGEGRRHGHEPQWHAHAGDPRSHRSGKRHLEPHGSQWSPDGQTLAFALLDLNSPRFTSAIFTLELESGELDRITPWRLNAGNPDWSPDGRRIAFNSHFEGQARSSLYTVAPDGTARRRLTNPKARLTYEPSFSPSGHRLVYVVAGRGVTLHLARMTVGGAERGRITRKTLRGVQPDWGPRP